MLVQMCLLLREQTEQRLALHDAIQRGDVTAQRRCHRVLDEIALRASRLGVPGM